MINKLTITHCVISCIIVFLVFLYKIDLNSFSKKIAKKDFLSIKNTINILLYVVLIFFFSTNILLSIDKINIDKFNDILYLINSFKIVVSIE